MVSNPKNHFGVSRVGGPVEIEVEGGVRAYHVDLIGAIITEGGGAHQMVLEGGQALGGLEGGTEELSDLSGGGLKREEMGYRLEKGFLHSFSYNSRRLRRGILMDSFSLPSLIIQEG